MFDQYRYIAPLKPNVNLQDLPMGKYIVCGEAHKEGHVVQANCFETIIDRLDNNSEFADLLFPRLNTSVVTKSVSQKCPHASDACF